MLNIVLFGPPYAGKGTQSEKLIQKYKLNHISTGDLFRAEIKNKTALGLTAKALIDKGKLVPDAVVMGMVKNHLESHKNSPGFIFDGFPRTVAQAEFLDELLEEMGTSITVMVALVVAKDELLRRCVERGKTSGRTDDNPQTAEVRIEVYDKETSPVAHYYASQDKFSPVNGIGSIEDIFNNICNVIDGVEVDS